MSRTSGFADLLQEVLRDEKLQPVADPASTTPTEVVLRERQAKMKFNVTNVPPSSTIVRIGRLNHLGGIKNGPWKKICDYLLVIPDGEKSCVVLVEMKKTLSDGQPAAMEQLRRTIPLVRYLQSLCGVQAGRPIQIDMRHVVLAEKTGSRFGKEPIRMTARVQLWKDEYEGNHVVTMVGTSATAEELIDG